MAYLQKDGKIISNGIEIGDFHNVYNETVAEFICNLPDYKSYGFEDGGDFLFGAETDDWHDNALYYQWYLAGMQFVLSLLQTNE